MLSENEIPNPFPFHPNSQKSFFITNVLTPILVYFVILLVLGFVAAMIMRSPFLLVLLLPAILFLAGVVFGWWYSAEFFRAFYFSLRSDHLFSRKGVFKASYTTIPYERIQDIHVTQSLFESLFGTWTVSLYTATATARGSETIHGLAKESAEALKSSLFAKIKKVRKVVD